MIREDLIILFYIKRNKLLQNGEAPIFVRITIDEQRVEFGIRKSVDLALWDSRNRRVKGVSKKSIQLNHQIEKIEMQIRSVYELLALDGDLVTPIMIKEKIVGKAKIKHPILQVFQEHNLQAKKLEGIDFAPDTLQRYETSYMHTKEFIKKVYRREDMTFSEINHQFIKNYEMYFKVERGCSHNTTIKYIKNFKKIVRIALANGWLKKDPFSNIKYTLTDVDTVYLDEKELDKMRFKELSNQRIARVKDVFVFCCFTGLAFADAKSLSWSDIVDRNGKQWIIKRRQKTKQESMVPLLPAAKAIIEKYENDPELQVKALLLPVLSNQKMNNYLKEISTLCGINKEISTHSARHTFATTVTLSNGISLEAVSKMLGHSSIDMTKRYARIREKLIETNMKKIEHLY